MSEKNEWKSIESAPKDGTPVLLFARHINAEASTRVVGSFDGNENGLGWHAQCYVGQPFARLDPSHWMELPPFPGSPAPSAPGDAQDERQAFEAWLARRGVWPALCFEEVFIAGWNARPADAPAAGDALDKARLDWLEQHNGRNQPIQNAPMVDSYSINGEDFQEGEASDALQDLYDRCQLEIGTEYRLGVAEKPDPADFFDVSHLIEQMQERAYDEGGEFAEDYLADLTEEQVHELDRVVKAWLTSVSPSVTFFSVKGIQTFSVTQEDIDSFRGRAGTEAA